MSLKGIKETTENTFRGSSAKLSQCIKERYTHVAGSARKSVNLTNQAAVERFFSQFNPEYIFLVAGKAGGILANQKYPADLMIDNLLIASNVIRSSFQCGSDTPPAERVASGSPPEGGVSSEPLHMFT